MPVQPGSRLGPYDVTAAVGAGGMGEVYRARDTRLGREVAIKILPASFASDKTRLSRFEREARLASSLSHPNIIVIHDVGHDDGTAYMVMELVPGRSLRSMIGSIDDVLAIATQIAAGLAAAHAAGVVHRDLKPENIMITPQGTAKILDFGLAKAAESDPGADEMTEEIITRGQVVFGTAAYMSPEQSSGLKVDFRTDQYSFGLIVIEMLTGRRDPVIPGDAPEPLKWILERCLEKDPARRYGSTQDLARDLASVDQRRKALMPPAARSSMLPYAIATAVVLAGLAVTLLWRNRAVHGGQMPAFVSIALPEIPILPLEPMITALALSPDGRRLVIYGAGPDGRLGLWLRELGSTTAVPIAGTFPGRAPVWSPDSKQIAFLGAGKLQVVTPGGGAPRVLCDVNQEGGTLTWGPGGEILFAQGLRTDDAGLFRVNAAGGPVQRLTTIDKSRQEVNHIWPEFLPDGKRFLFLARVGGAEQLMLKLGSLEGGPTREIGPIHSRMVVRGTTAYYVRDGTLLAQPIDLDAVALTGDPVPVMEGFQYYQSTGAATFSVSNEGTIAARTALGSSRIIVLSREGQQTAEVGPGYYGQVRIAPDGKRFAVSAASPRVGTGDLWVHDLSGKGASRLTFQNFGERAPTWSPDGRSIFFRSDKLGSPDIYRFDLETNRSSAGLERPGIQEPCDVSPDGSELLLQESQVLNPPMGVDLVAWSLRPGGAVREVVRTPFDERDARYSRSGRWIAFASLVSGRWQVYVIRTNGSGTPQTVSTNGGTRPNWAGGDRELIYLASANDLMSVSVREADGQLELSEPKLLLRSALEIAEYDVTPDGKHFVIRTKEKDTLPPIQLLFNAPRP